MMWASRRYCVVWISFSGRARPSCPRGSHVEDVLDRTSPLVIEADLKGFDADDKALFADELSVPIPVRRHHVDDWRRARGRRFSLDVL